MRMCLKCHGATRCETPHQKVVLRGAGPPCGICSGELTEVDCSSPMAREVHSFNMALANFGLSMRRKFIENLDKGGWQDIDYAYALARLLHEAGELSEKLMVPVKGPTAYEGIVDEASDVANFALFLHHRARLEQARDEGIAKIAHEAWVKIKKERGECYNPDGPCRDVALTPEKFCDVCKEKIAAEETKRLSKGAAT